MIKRKKKYQMGGNYSNLTVDDDPYLMFPESTIYDSLNDKNDAEKASKINWRNKFQDALPYVTNVVNAFSKLPKPRKPLLEQTISPELVNYDADRLTIDKQQLGINKGIDQSTSNVGVANANKVATLGKVLEAKGRLTQTEKNTNADIINQSRRFNTSITARNVERRNEFQDALLARKLKQQQLRTENLADVSNKAQMSRRDKDLMDLEDRKLNILLATDHDTGVFNRNLYDEYLKELYNKKKYGGTIHIKPENRGKFNALKARTGKSTEELTHSPNALTRKRAIFAQNAAKWNH